MSLPGCRRGDGAWLALPGFPQDIPWPWPHADSTRKVTLQARAPPLRIGSVCWNITAGPRCVIPRDWFYLVLYIQGHLYKIQHFHTM